MKVIINADDYGFSPGISDSVIELFHNNAISNTTVMMAVDGIEDQCLKLKGSGFSHLAGVHLQTNLDQSKKNPLNTLDQVCDEWDFQIQKFITIFEHNPTHLDSHYSPHLIPELTQIYLKLAEKYALPVRGGKVLGELGETTVLSSSLMECSWTGQGLGIDSLKEKILRGLYDVADGVLEVVVHPGFVDEQLKKVSSWTDVRENDHNVLFQLAQEKWLEKEGIQLVSFSDLK